MPVESLEEFGNRWRDRALEAELEIQRLRAELSDWQHNLALRAFTTPDADLATILASLDARIRDALAASSAPADQNLRDRLRHVLAREIREDWGTDRNGPLEGDEFGDMADAVLAVLPAPANEAPPLLAEVWTVWCEDESTWGYFATEDTGKTGTIDYYEEQEERCPDYGWRQDGPRLELLAGGETTGIYLSRHPVYGKPAVPGPRCLNPLSHEPHEWLADSDAVTLSPCDGRAVPSAPADENLRDRIAQAVRTVRLRLGPNAIAMAQRGEPIILNLNEADALAAAVLAVLPAPADRAAVLREAAEAVSPHSCSCRGRLLRMADQAQQAGEGR